MILAPTALTGVLWLTQLNPVSPEQAALALALAFVPWWTFLHWQRSADSRFPVFAAISFAYWLYYALPLFWGDRFQPTLGRAAFVSDSAVTGAMVMAVLGVACAWAGYRSGVGRRVRLRPRVELRETAGTAPYVRWVLALSTLSSLALTAGLEAPDSIRQIVLDVQLYIPLIAYAVLLRRTLRGAGTRLDTALLLAYALVALGNGLYHSQLGLVVTPVLGALAVYVWERRRIPLFPLVVGLALVLLLQPTKTEIRKQFGVQEAISGGQSSLVDRARSWVGSSVDAWTMALEDPTSGAPLDLVRVSVQRTSLLTQTAHVLDWTPDLVPFQNGATYTYLEASLVPRFLWPDKPSASDANQWYQLAYGISTPATLSTVSIASGSLTEAYFNFEWAGVVVVMFLLGIVFDFVATSLLTAEAGEFLGALGIVTLLQLIIIESQLAFYLSGIVETAILALVIFFPVLRFGGRAGARSRLEA